MKEYDMICSNNKKITVIAKSITHALELIDLYEENIEVIDCKFIRNISTIIVERP